MQNDKNNNNKKTYISHVGLWTFRLHMTVVSSGSKLLK